MCIGPNKLLISLFNAFTSSFYINAFCCLSFSGSIHVIFSQFLVPRKFSFCICCYTGPKSIRCYLFFPFCADKKKTKTKVILVFASTTERGQMCVCVMFFLLHLINIFTLGLLQNRWPSTLTFW